jgi:hypothetical protein
MIENVLCLKSWHNITLNSKLAISLYLIKNISHMQLTDSVPQLRVERMRVIYFYHTPFPQNHSLNT